MRIVSPWVCSALLLGAGCGGAERSGISSGTADALAQRSDGIAAALERGDRCEADRLADALVSASRGARLPRAYRAPLLDAADSLAARLDCPPAAPPKEEKPKKKHEEPKKKKDDHKKPKHEKPKPTDKR